MTLHNSDILFGNEFAKALNMAITALEKQEAKKPRYSEPFYDDVGCFAFDVSCPTCGKKLDVENVCPKCGQRIDWSEVDDEVD